MSKKLDNAFIQKLNHLITQYRSQCLWFNRPDYIPESEEEILRTLRHIENHADSEGYKKARDLKKWLLQISNDKSAD